MELVNGNVTGMIAEDGAVPMGLNWCYLIL